MEFSTRAKRRAFTGTGMERGAWMERGATPIP
jgi:hypothetical protein